MFLPLQEDVFPDTDDFGRVFRNNAVMSAMGIPQITAIMGMCVAGGAYLPVMCDHILMTEGSGLFLAGPALVQAAIGQKASAEELGGAQDARANQRHRRFSRAGRRGLHRRIRALVDKMGHPPGRAFDRKPRRAARVSAEEIYGIFSADPSKQYDMREIIARIVDGSRLRRISRRVRPDAPLRLRAHRRLGRGHRGEPEEECHRRPTPGTGEKRIEFGGVIYTESADKAARFILDCNQNLIPLIFLHDVNGFMVGKEAEGQRHHPRGRQDGERRGQ